MKERGIHPESSRRWLNLVALAGFVSLHMIAAAPAMAQEITDLCDSEAVSCTVEGDNFMVTGEFDPVKLGWHIAESRICKEKDPNGGVISDGFYGKGPVVDNQTVTFVAPGSERVVCSTTIDDLTDVIDRFFTNTEVPSEEPIVIEIPAEEAQIVQPEATEPEVVEDEIQFVPLDSEELVERVEEGAVDLLANLFIKGTPIYIIALLVAAVYGVKALNREARTTRKGGRRTIIAQPIDTVYDPNNQVVVTRKGQEGLPINPRSGYVLGKAAIHERIDALDHRMRNIRNDGGTFEDYLKLVSEKQTLLQIFHSHDNDPDLVN